MDVYTMADWQRDGTFNAAPGQEITEDIYNEMQNTVPPKAIRKETARQAWEQYRIPVHAGFLMGEPTSTDEQGRELYRAFGSNDYGRGRHCYYLGLGREYEPLNGTYYYFDCMNAFVNDGLFPAAEFETEAEAIRYAADYEATLIRYVYDHGNKIETAVLYQPMFL